MNYEHFTPNIGACQLSTLAAPDVVLAYNRPMIPQPLPLLEPLGRRIARLRACCGWTQEDLAERLAISRVAISHFEMGLAVPSERTVVLMAGLFKQEPFEFVAGTTYPAAKTERLPHTACRYTELEFQLALLQRDVGWMARLAEEGSATNEIARCLDEWRAKLATLHEQSVTSEQRALVAAAYEQLRCFRQR